MIGRGNLLLLAGMGAGLALAAFDLIGHRTDAVRPGPDVVAAVNGRAIRRDDYDRALRAVAADRRDHAVDDALRRRVLDRLIDEELLVERALELGLAERDPTVRANLAGAVLSLVGARGEEDDAPDNDALKRFLDENRPLFREPERLRVRPRGAPDGGASRLPDAPLPLAKWRDYLGETATAALAGAPLGAAIPLGDGREIELAERKPARDPALAEIRDAVRAEYLRRAGDRRLRALLDERRASSEIELAADAPAPSP